MTDPEDAPGSDQPWELPPGAGATPPGPDTRERLQAEANRLAEIWINGNQLRAEANRLAETWINGNRKDVIATLAAAPPLTAAFLAATLVLLLDDKDADIARRCLLIEAEENIDDRRETP